MEEAAPEGFSEQLMAMAERVMLTETTYPTRGSIAVWTQYRAILSEVGMDEEVRMLTPKIAGAVILGIPLIIVAWAVLWRRQRPVFVFALVLIYALWPARKQQFDEAARIPLRED